MYFTVRAVLYDDLRACAECYQHARDDRVKSDQRLDGSCSRFDLLHPARELANDWKAIAASSVGSSSLQSSSFPPAAITATV